MTSNDLVTAQGCTTGSNAGGYTLSSIAAVIGPRVDDQESAVVRAELWSAAAGGGPGSKIVHLTYSVILRPQRMAVSFEAPANTWLPANTTFFFVPYTTTIFYDLALDWVTSTAEDSNSQAGWGTLDHFHWQTGNLPGACWTQGATANVMAIRVNGAAASQGVVPAAPPGLGEVRAPELELYESEERATGSRRFVIAGDLGSGPVLAFEVPDRNLAGIYSVRVIEVTGEDHRLLEPDGYRAAITSN